MSEEDKKPIKLVRMPDGSMRPATDIDSDIGDVWSAQQKIRASEAQAEQIAKQHPKVRPKKRLLKKLQKKQATAAPVTVIMPQSSPTAVPTTKVAKAPVPTAYRNQVSASPKKATDTKTTIVVPKEIAISVTMPKIKAPKAIKTTKAYAKKGFKVAISAPKWAYVAALFIFVPVVLIGFGATHKPAPKKGDVQGQKTAAVPDFQTLAPNGDVTDTTSQKIQYDANKKVASFTDKIDGYEVTVSMQPIPASFKPAIADNVKKVAEQFSANTVLTVDNGAAYLGTSAKGPQSFVGYRGDLLVFMKSQTKIANNSWSEYFNSLK